MCRILFNSFVIICLLLGYVCPEDFKDDYRDADILQVFDLDLHLLSSRSSKFNPKLSKPSEIDRLNIFLVEGFLSGDPERNLDFVLEQLLLDQKNGVPSNDPSSQAKRLLLALSTLGSENRCSYYSYRILSSNYDAIRPVAKLIAQRNCVRRIDKILAYYINTEIKDCGSVYLGKFDVITERIDPEANRKLNAVFRSIIESAISDEHENNVDKSLAERLFNAATFKIRRSFRSEPEGIYSALRELSAGDPDAIYLTPVEDEITGLKVIREDKFERIFDEYITEPCKYFRRQYGPEVFEPISFANIFSPQLQEDRPDFYEAWFKFELCSELTYVAMGNLQKKDVKDYAIEMFDMYINRSSFLTGRNAD